MKHSPGRRRAHRVRELCGGSPVPPPCLPLYPSSPTQRISAQAHNQHPAYCAGRERERERVPVPACGGGRGGGDREVRQGREHGGAQGRRRRHQPQARDGPGG